MSAFAKAKALIEREAAARGGYPDCIGLTRYPDAATFERFFPGEDFDRHERERAALVDWCRARRIQVITETVGASWPDGPADRAEKAAPFHWRLGLDIGGRATLGERAIGWAAVNLDSTAQKGTE